MTRNEKIYTAALLSLLVILIVLRFNAPRPVDWTPTLSVEDEIPYGTLVLYESLEDLFPGQEATFSKLTFFELQDAGLLRTPLPGKSGEATAKPKALVVMYNSFSPGPEDLKVLLQHVRQGGTAFIAAHYFDDAVLDSLNVDTRSTWALEEMYSNYDSLGINFVNPALKAPQDYYYKTGSTSYFFSEFDAESHTILGTNEAGKPNFLEVPLGRGHLYLHSNPLVFTNYNVLQTDKADYIAKALSYLPDRDLLWSEYYSTGRNEARTPLRFILSQPPLKWAWFLTIASMVLVLLFLSKRRQRAVPVKAPPRNQSMDFVHTIGQLYFQEGNHRKLAIKKITYFKEFLRKQLYFNLTDWSDDTLAQLKEKSDLPREQLVRLFRLVRLAYQKTVISEEELMLISDELEKITRSVIQKR